MTFEDNVTAARNYMNSYRFSGITRLYSARQVAEQQGTIESGYPVARANAEAFYDRLRELFSVRKSITTFGPYSPSQAVTIPSTRPVARARPGRRQAYSGAA